jgi:hypothetical protein
MEFTVSEVLVFGGGNSSGQYSHATWQISCVQQQSKMRWTYQSVYMLRVGGSDLEDAGNPEVLVPFYAPLRGILSSDIYKVIVLVYLTLDCKRLLASPAQSIATYFYSLMKLLYFFIDSHSALGVTV